MTLVYEMAVMRNTLGKERLKIWVFGRFLKIHVTALAWRSAEACPVTTGN